VLCLRVLTPAIASSEQNSETGFGGDRDKPLSIAKKREAQSLRQAASANVRFPSERGTDKRDEN
jgi:hypothetical protein